MILVASIFVATILQCSCFPSKKYAVPMIDNQNAPLVAIVDTGKIVQKIVESLGEPVEELVNKTIVNAVNILKKKDSELEQKLIKMEQSVYSQISTVQQEIVDANRPVAMTSCSTSTLTVDKGDIILFPDLRTSIGINAKILQSFKQTGRFRCEKPGHYMVTTSILSFHSSNAYYSIYKGSTNLRNVQITPSGRISKDIGYHTGTGSVIVMLNVNDTVHVLSDNKMKIYGNKYSCFTVLEIN